MKNIFALIVGILIIILSNTYISFLPIFEQVELIVIYLILVCIYSNFNAYFLCFLGLLLGFLQDAYIGLYSMFYTCIFFVFVLCGIYMRDKIRKDSFFVSFFICLAFLIGYAVYSILIYYNTRIISQFSYYFMDSILYISKNMSIMAISIIFINAIIRKMER